MEGFGLVAIKKEGAACHPEAYGIGHANGYKYTDEQYLNQLRAYAEWAGVEETKSVMCSRPHLLELI